MRYLPHTPEDERSMLDTIGVDSIDTLFAEIPQALQLDRPLDLPRSLSEPELLDHMNSLAGKNSHSPGSLSFLGSGSYRHHVPTWIPQLVSRGEFLTPYTPYQPEISQGTLQVIFEYQSMMCAITGMEVANASLYDASTATVEAMLMAQRVKRRNHMLVIDSVHPEYRHTAETTLHTGGLAKITTFASQADGTVDLAALQTALTDQYAAVVVQYPNVFGSLDDIRTIAEHAHSVGALCVVVVPDPVALGVLEAPGVLGADIVVSEGQALGNAINYGGPYVGIFATKKQFVRQMPGRLAGITVDADGKRGFVLTLSTREQHIRREKATSNICTNQQLCALGTAMHAATLGAEGFRTLAELNWQKANYAKQTLGALAGVQLPMAQPNFHEFVIRTPKPAAAVLEQLAVKNIFGGVALSRWFTDRPNDFVVCVTECNTKAHIDTFAAALQEVLA